MTGGWRAGGAAWRAPLARLRGSSLVRASGAYAASSIVNRAIPFLLLPVLTRYLPPEDFGKAAMFTVAVNLALPFVGLTTDAAIARQYFERERVDFPGYVSSCFYLLAATAAVALGAALFFPGAIGRMLELPAGWVWSIVVVAAARFVVNTMLTLWQVQHRPGPYALLSLAQTALTFALSLVFIVSFGFGWKGRVLGELLAVSLLALVCAVLLWRAGWVRPGLNPRYIAHAVRYSGWLLPHLYGSVLMAATDRLLLTNLVDVGQTGLYSVAAQIAAIVAVAGQSFNLAWSPWAYERLKRNDAASRAAVARARRLYNGGILALAALLAMVAPAALGPLLGAEYEGAAGFAPWLVAGQAFSAMYAVAVTPFFYAGKTHFLAGLSLSMAAVNLLFNLVLISASGAVGAAQANALTLLAMYLVAAALAGRLTRRLAGDRPPAAQAAPLDAIT